MKGDRRPSPETQVRAALAVAKRQGAEFDEAWPLATNGNVCDDYSSSRGDGQAASLAQPELAGGPPNLRAATGQKRCAGCRFVMGAGQGPARCTLYEVPIYPGVLWPHRTEDRHEWKRAILDLEDDWRAAYDGIPHPRADVIDLLRRYVLGEDLEQHEVERGSVAA